jgi:dihydroxyacid dehydratase/phosphogluconate dehydratase
MQAIKGLSENPIKPGDVIILIGGGPSGTGMEETYQVTSALKFIPWGKTVPVLTDARFSGVSTGACIGHIGPEALGGGPIGKLQDGDMIEIEINRHDLSGRIDFVGTKDKTWSPSEAADLLAKRPLHSTLKPHPALPDDTRLWAALQRASGGTWAGCIYDADTIIKVIDAGLSALENASS